MEGIIMNIEKIWIKSVIGLMGGLLQDEDQVEMGILFQPIVVGISMFWKSDPGEKYYRPAFGVSCYQGSGEIPIHHRPTGTEVGKTAPIGKRSCLGRRSEGRYCFDDQYSGGECGL
jgi:hypothetical protein